VQTGCADACHQRGKPPTTMLHLHHGVMPSVEERLPQRHVHPHAQQHCRVQRTARSVGAQPQVQGMRCGMFSCCVQLHTAQAVTIVPEPRWHRCLLRMGASTPGLGTWADGSLDPASAPGRQTTPYTQPS
jgi:hypothetical protein